MIEKIKKYAYAILAISSILLLMLFLNECQKSKNLKQKLKNEKKIAAQNYAALTDSIFVYKNILGETSFSKPIAQMNKDDVKKYFPDLYKRLESELGEVKVIWQTQFVYKDTGSVVNSIVKLDSTQYSLKYDYYSSDSSLHIKSSNTFFAEPYLVDSGKYNIKFNSGVSSIEDMSLKMGFTTGIKKENDLYKIFLTPSNNNIVITSLEGADVTNMISSNTPIQKQKKWSVGLYIGYGVAFGKNNQYVLGPTTGISLQYAIFSF